ncbi:unnamed protein product [Calypogeia fissa]
MKTVVHKSSLYRSWFGSLVPLSPSFLLVLLSFRSSNPPSAFRAAGQKFSSVNLSVCLCLVWWIRLLHTSSTTSVPQRRGSRGVVNWSGHESHRDHTTTIHHKSVPYLVVALRPRGQGTRGDPERGGWWGVGGGAPVATSRRADRVLLFFESNGTVLGGVGWGRGAPLPCGLAWRGLQAATRRQTNELFGLFVVVVCVARVGGFDRSQLPTPKARQAKGLVSRYRGPITPKGRLVANGPWVTPKAALLYWVWWVVGERGLVTPKAKLMVVVVGGCRIQGVDHSQG